MQYSKLDSKNKLFIVHYTSRHLYSTWGATIPAAICINLGGGHPGRHLTPHIIHRTRVSGLLLSKIKAELVLSDPRADLHIYRRVAQDAE